MYMSCIYSFSLDVSLVLALILWHIHGFSLDCESCDSVYRIRMGRAYGLQRPGLRWPRRVKEIYQHITALLTASEMVNDNQPS
jgi:hypothetical protein